MALWLDATAVTGDVRLFVSFLFGLLAEIATGLVIAGAVVVTGGSAMPANPADFPSWVPIVAIVAGSLFTFLIGFWRASRQSENYVGHGLSVAAGAIVLHLATTLGGQTLTVLHVVADVLKLVAGAVAGVAAQRRAGGSA